ncbi:MAG: hypothetical protein ACXW6T_17205, partial [Candidatus Binatia bacterium]
MRKKITRRAFCSMLLALPFPAYAQQPGKNFRIGFLDVSTPSGMAVLIDAFRQGDQGDLIVVWGGFLCSNRAVICDEGAACTQKISPGPSFPKRVTDNLPGWVTMSLFKEGINRMDASI